MVGDAVGGVLGAKDGACVGDGLGSLVGGIVGDEVGGKVGANVGAEVGEKNGAAVGSKLGCHAVIFHFVGKGNCQLTEYIEFNLTWKHCWF